MGRLLVLFVVLPAVELALLIELGQRIGTLATLTLIVVSGVVGASLARSQGLQVLKQVQERISMGEMPAEPLLDGLLILIAALFCTSALIRTYAWTEMFDTAGPVNEGLRALGLIREPLAFLGAAPAVYLGMVYAYLPVMVLAIYLSLLRLDYSLVEAARDLGGRTGRIFLLIIVPISLPGVIAGCLLVFIPASGEFAVPWLLGGQAFPAAGTAIWTEFFVVQNWPRVAAMVALLLLALIVPTVFLFKAALMPVIRPTPRQQIGPVQ